MNSRDLCPNSKLSIPYPERIEWTWRLKWGSFVGEAIGQHDAFEHARLTAGSRSFAATLLGMTRRSAALAARKAGGK